MAVAAHDYLFSKDRCKDRAERSSNEEVRQAWFNLAESYAVLMMLEKIQAPSALISGKRLE